MNVEQETVLNTVEELLTSRCGRAEELPEAWWPELWGELVSLGFADLGRPGEREELGPALPFLVARACAKFGVPLPFGDVAAIAGAVAPSVHAGGDGPIVVAPPSRSLPRLVRASDGGWRLSGVVRAVPWGRHAACIVVHARTAAGRVYAVEVRPEEGELHERVNLAGEVRDDLRLELSLGAERVFVPSLGPEPTCAYGALLRAAEMVGAMTSVLELSLDYARERHQFGRPIGRFQAVQQLMLTIAAEHRAAAAALDTALRTLTGPNYWFFAGAAKIRAGRAAGLVARAAHQIHGAIGYTREFPLHRLTRRLWAWRDEYGCESAWSLAIGQQIVSAGSDAGWEAITSRSAAAPAVFGSAPLVASEAVGD